MALTRDLETRIVQLMFEQAEAAGWTYLPDRQRTEMYNRWVQDPEVGGRLQAFMTAEEARVWVKDGVMKEYARAIYGVGKYAPLVGNPAAGPRQLVQRALGPAWEVDLSTREIKPLRLLARKGEDTVHFTWGPGRDLKHLLWAALTAEAAGDVTPWVLCLVGSFERPIPADEKALHLRLGERCGLQIVHVNGG
jgi:hypothetical protein